MSSSVMLSIHQADDVVIDDFDALNRELLEDFHGGFGELYDEFTSEPDFVGPFKLSGKTLQIANNWDGGFNGYGNSTMVWGCYSDVVFEIISRHMKSGKLVFLIAPDGWDNEYRVVTPNTVQTHAASAIKF